MGWGLILFGKNGQSLEIWNNDSTFSWFFVFRRISVFCRICSKSWVGRPEAQLCRWLMRINFVACGWWQFEITLPGLFLLNFYAVFFIFSLFSLIDMPVSCDWSWSTLEPVGDENEMKLPCLVCTSFEFYLVFFILCLSFFSLIDKPDSCNWSWSTLIKMALSWFLFLSLLVFL